MGGLALGRRQRQERKGAPAERGGRQPTRGFCVFAPLFSSLALPFEGRAPSTRHAHSPLPLPHLAAAGLPGIKCFRSFIHKSISRKAIVAPGKEADVSGGAVSIEPAWSLSRRLRRLTFMDHGNNTVQRAVGAGARVHRCIAHSQQHVARPHLARGRSGPCGTVVDVGSCENVSVWGWWGGVRVCESE